MFRRQVLRTVLAVLVATLAAAGVQLATGAPAAAVRTVYYDASRTGEFRTNFDQAAQIWNSRVSTVRLQPGTPASITIYVDDGWPRAQPTGLGSGRIWMGRTAVNQGYDRNRIAAHELGHILGLPDRRTGLCTDLMSGSSAPVSCRNANPSSAEASRVNSLFAGSLTAPATGTTYTWDGAGDVGPTVVGGRPASENYPFMVYVSGCTGTLIKANWAVTAKHCSTPSSVRVGSINRSSGGSVVSVTRAVNHPSVDVKLFQLGSSVSYAGPDPEHLRRGRHRHPDHRLGSDLRASGLRFGSRGGQRVGHVHRGRQQVLRDQRPVRDLHQQHQRKLRRLLRRLGGPQVRRVNGVWNLIGATSRAGNNNSTCATGPSIYVDLPSIRSWINTQVGGLPV
ncbi:hypothetical protein GCM10027614_16960 [Micromonospora vulcania]